MMDLESKLEYCRLHINDCSIYRVTPGNTPLPGKAPGTHYTWQFYLRRSLFDPTVARYIGDLFWDMYEGIFRQSPFQIGACEDAGVPVACAIQAGAMARNIKINVFTVKKSAKAYGLMNMTEGIPMPELPVMLVDDLAGSQQTLKNAYRLLCEIYNMKIYKDHFVIVDKDIGTHRQAYMTESECVSLFRASDFDLNYNDYVESTGYYPQFGAWL